ncbi:VCBS repeat-containing protein, partial [Streptomyces sp. NPDC005573]|uniref:C40 family peptidase n=1 Tax=Streptomyces sp. NPDC005573 TaxID=3156890 RepID=UPI0033A39146
MPRTSIWRSASIALVVTVSLSGGMLGVAAGTAGAAPASHTFGVRHAGGGQGPVTPVAPGRGLASVSNPTITRSEVLDRADSWVGIGLQYDWNGSHDGYRTDCSGYASMAWKLGSSLTTDTFASAGVTESISKGDLKAGDALLNDSSGASGHVVLFDKWTDSSHSSYIGYEFTSSGVHHREIPYPYFSGYGTFLPVRNKSVVDDTVPPPADAGMTELTAGDFNNDGDADLVAVEVSTGKLFMYPGNGKGVLGARVEIGTGGWNGMKNLAVGDFNGDGKDDLVGTETSTGKLWLYKGTGSGLSARTEIGTGGWNGMSNVFVGDFNGDGKDDLGASEDSTGKLWLYKGTGTGTLTARTEIGSGGWNGMNKVTSPGDMNGDGKDDVVATETSTGKLWLYKGTGSGLAARTEIGTGGWNGISDYAGADFTGDGIGDLAA